MRLSQLLSLFPQLSLGEWPTKEIARLTDDSASVVPGDVFVAIRGYKKDGHDFLPEVCQQGAIAVVVESKAQVPRDFRGAVVQVKDTREALNLLASRYFGDPAFQCFNVGVTGTNGKTTITYMVESILTHFGWPTGVMGTVDHHLGRHKWESQLTTPPPLVLQKRLSEFVALGAKAVTFEVSSHAIQQRRVERIPFNALVFTNLTQDHLDYHGTMEEYFLVKQKLFTELALSDRRRVVGVVNRDDPYGQRLQVADGVQVWTYGQGEADLSFKILSAGLSGSRFYLNTFRGEKEMEISLPGIHNIYNAVAAVGVGLSAGASLEVCAQALSQFAGVPGRLEIVPNSQGRHVFVDYAHTPDALESVLSSVRLSMAQTKDSGRLIVVFGCGGDRDKGKRPLMMKATLDFADFVVVTSDNPRNEDPMNIIRDIVNGLSEELLEQKVLIEPDRRKAIEEAVRVSAPGDVILIAGKGHEDFQIVGHTKASFSDSQVVGEILQ